MLGLQNRLIKKVNISFIPGESEKRRAFGGL